MNKILVVCVGNICRSPVGERLLAQALPERFTVSSAGIGALEGHGADKTAAEVAAARGLSLEGHVARQLTSAMAGEADLILVMEAGHKREIIKRMPEQSGKIMVFDQWDGAQGIADPYQRPVEMHEAVHDQIAAAAKSWAARLSPKRR